MKINLKNLKQFTLSGLIILLILVVTVFVLVPKMQAIIDLRQQSFKDKKTLVNLTKKLAALEGLAQVEFSEKVSVALSVLPAEKNVPENLGTIKSLALNNNLIVSNITIGDIGEITEVSLTQKTAKDTTMPFFKINVGLIGEIKMINNFINQIQSAAPLMKVRNVSISQKKMEIPEARIEIEAYFLPFPKNLGKTEQQLINITNEEEKVFNRLLNEFTFLGSDSILPNLPVGKENLFSP